MSVRPASKRQFDQWLNDVDFIKEGEIVTYFNDPTDLKRFMNIIEARHTGEELLRRRSENLDELINRAERGERFSLIGD